jgi:hypothetical protein
MFRLSERDLLSAVIERTLDRATPNNNGVGGGGNRTKKVPIDPSLSLIENLSIRILTYTRPGMAASRVRSILSFLSRAGLAVFVEGGPVGSNLTEWTKPAGRIEVG